MLFSLPVTSRGGRECVKPRVIPVTGPHTPPPSSQRRRVLRRPACHLGGNGICQTQNVWPFPVRDLWRVRLPIPCSATGRESRWKGPYSRASQKPVCRWGVHVGGGKNGFRHLPPRVISAQTAKCQTRQRKAVCALRSRSEPSAATLIPLAE